MRLNSVAALWWKLKTSLISFILFKTNLPYDTISTTSIALSNLIVHLNASLSVPLAAWPSFFAQGFLPSPSVFSTFTGSILLLDE